MTLFHDTVQSAGSVTAAVADRVDVGDITLPAGNWVITRVWAHAMLAGTITAVEGIMGYIQIESTDCSIAPCEFLLEPITGALGTGEMEAPVLEPRKYIVNCNAPGGAVLSVYHVCDATISTSLSEVIVTVEFSQASPFGSGQIHMKCGEPSVTGSVSDGGTADLTNIEIKASKLLAVVTYVAAITAVASTGHMLMFEMKSTDFAENGPHRWATNVQRAGGVATNSSGQLAQTQFVEVDAGFTSPGQKQTISAVVTAYDAVTTGPEVNWCLVYV
ncbi:unnamed protein product [marine sediment metagenome]|uniref:Uncharacterized protein n=1 Tax=marine sediment metagenome TaxID=412755 RepID=X0YV46_9ZZZZ